MNAGAEAAAARALPLGRGVRVAAFGPGTLLALDKPPGVLTHPNPGAERGRGATLLAADYDFAGERYCWTPAAAGDCGALYLANRLDSPTSGLVLGALDETTAAAARAEFAAGRAHKTYFALVRGRPQPPRGRWTDRLARGQSPGARGVRVAVGGGKDSQTAVTDYTVAEVFGAGAEALALLRLEPRTGRTHQLRVQCAAHGCPIVGDATYGDFAFNRAHAKRTGEKRLFLHAAALRLSALGFAADSPLPAEFQTLFTSNI